MALATAAIWSPQALALGLGRLTVQSALGEPLRAEIEVTSLSSEEASTLVAKVATADAYRAAGVDYNPVLPGTTLQLVRRPDGRAVIRATSNRAVMEPFVDVILELTWSGGRLVREVTMLLDPPGTRTAEVQPAASVPPAMGAAPVAAAPPPPRPAAAERRAAAPRAEPAAPRTTAPAVAQAGGADKYVVRPGDTLSRIAARVQRPSVSLDQMLVALFRGNADAFMGNNMNRLRAGAVLDVPGAEAAQQLSNAQAREVIHAQSTDFAAYRQQLASGAAPAVEAPQRQAKGQVQTTVQDSRQAAAATPDKLTLSQPTVKPTEAAAKDGEKKDPATRVAELSRNVEELKQLQAATARASAPAGSDAPPAAATAASAPAPAVVAAAVPASVPAAAAPATRAASAAPARPAPPPAVSEPGFVDSLLENPLLLPGAGVLLALLAGFGAYRLRGRLRKSESETSFLESRLQPDSFFGASGGQRVDTHDAAGPASAASSMSYSLSQLDAIGDVDPVAEADVYLAYGRDLQAEEILKEAMRSNPDRLAVRSKLLEVYAKRRDSKGFELHAGQLFSLAGADSDDWKRAQELGRQIDPDNALYAPGARPGTGARAGGGRAVEPLDATTLPQTVMPAAPAPAQPAAAGLTLDLDLGASAERDAGEVTRPFNIDASMAEDAADTRAASQPRSTAAAPLDFDLGEMSLGGSAAKAAVSTTPADDFSASLPSLAFDEGGDPLARKLELAMEFRQIGDVEGARDLLEEVVASAEGALKVKAQGMLDKLT